MAPPDSLTQNPATAHVVCLCGYRRGSPVRQSWVVVFDTAGNRLESAALESASAVEIRYVETMGAPAHWKRHPGVHSPGDFERLRDTALYRLAASSAGDSLRSTRYTHKNFRETYAPRAVAKKLRQRKG